MIAIPSVLWTTVMFRQGSASVALILMAGNAINVSLGSQTFPTVNGVSAMDMLMYVILAVEPASVVGMQLLVIIVTGGL